MKRWTVVIAIALLVAGVGVAVAMTLIQRARAEDVARMRQETAALARVIRNAGMPAARPR